MFKIFSQSLNQTEPKQKLIFPCTEQNPTKASTNRQRDRSVIHMYAKTVKSYEQNKQNPYAINLKSMIILQEVKDFSTHISVELADEA